jgi:ABC-2 type transport system permease protein
VGRAVVLIGAEITLGCLLIPIMFSRSQLVEPRAFLGYGFRSATVAAITLLLTLVGPALLLIPAALVPVTAWRHFPDVERWAAIAAPLIVIQLVLVLRIGVAVGVWLRRFVQWRSWARVVGVLTLLAGLLMIVALLLPRAVLQAHDRSLAVAAPLARLLRPLGADRVADVLGGSPLASLWGAPGLAVAGVGNPAAAIWIGVLVIVVLALLWWALVRGALDPTRRLRITRAERVPAWFRRLPATPAGAVAARSFIYWIRDPRYNIVFGILPLLPIFTALAFFIGGVPLRIGAFVPLALMVLVLAWSTIHNDIAYDSTAVWSHVAAQTRGLHDRLGRIWPVLILGALLIVVGTPFTVWAQGDLGSLPAVLGINIALLLGGIGVGSALAPRFPYPAPRPGDGAFTFPQASGGTGGAAQAGSFFLTIVVALPSIAATTFWLMGFGGALNWVALVAGIVTGVIALVLGIRGGAAVFDRRGPELLAFTMQN